MLNCELQKFRNDVIKEIAFSNRNNYLIFVICHIKAVELVFLPMPLDFISCDRPHSLSMVNKDEKYPSCCQLLLI